MRTLNRAALTLVLATAARAEDVPLFEGLGDHHRKVTTESEKAQAYFDQGLAWTFAFNHDEAIRSFTEAARLDPDCAMAYWGIAYCHGPHINHPVMTPEASRAAWAALTRAKALRGNASEVERALIDALATRYSDPAPDDRGPLDRAYAAAMKQVRAAYRDDTDIAHLYAESLMDLQPWDLWTKDGKPRGRTTEILAVIEAVLERAPEHAGLHHLYIHCVEASPFPERGVASADFLRDAMPGSGHMVHMPSHIDVQVGEWAKATEANRKAIAADRRYRELSPRQGFYRFYMFHNDHFLCFANMMQGRRAEAIRAAREMVASIPRNYRRANAALVDSFLAIEAEALMRFGRWDEILALSQPDPMFPIATAKWRYARAAAFGAKGELRHARAEQSAFRFAVQQVPENAMVVLNRAHTILEIAEHALEGELRFREGDVDGSVKRLREAVAIEDDLIYMEPPEWIQPVRHTLGAVLMSAGRMDEAERVYRKDLEEWPENGWSLFGLWKCVAARGAADEAADLKERFARTWAHADIQIAVTCLCVPEGTGATEGTGAR